MNEASQATEIVLGIRYGGVIAIMETAKASLLDYLEGNTEAIADLEKDRLRVDCTSEDSAPINHCFLWRSYATIATVNRIIN